MPDELSDMARKVAEEVRKRRAEGGAPPAQVRQRPNCVPSCPICHELGWYVYDVTVGHPMFGKPVRCPNYPVTADGSGIEDEFATITWDDILPEGNAAEAVDAVMAAIERGYGWVYLFGRPGRAKTLILRRAVKEAIQRGYRAQYTLTTDVLSMLRASFDEERKQFSLDSKLEILSSQQVLALDEFDRFNNTPWAQEQIFRIMNERYVSALHKATVTLMASNASPTVYPDYLSDRIYDARFMVIHLTGDSLRPAADWSMP